MTIQIRVLASTPCRRASTYVACVVLDHNPSASSLAHGASFDDVPYCSALAGAAAWAAAWIGADAWKAESISTTAAAPVTGAFVVGSSVEVA